MLYIESETIGVYPCIRMFQFDLKSITLSIKYSYSFFTNFQSWETVIYQVYLVSIIFLYSFFDSQISVVGNGFSLWFSIYKNMKSFKQPF